MHIRLVTYYVDRFLVDMFSQVLEGMTQQHLIQSTAITLHRRYMNTDAYNNNI